MVSALAQHNFTHSAPASNPPEYPIRGTHVTSPYPVSLTPAETRLIFTLEKYISPDCIFADYYTTKITSRTRYNADLTNPTLNTNKSLPGSDLVQIDCLAISRQGIFVFESKDYSGWIYGNGSNNYWTEVLNYGKEKHRFYNPVKQNSLHLAALTDFLPENLPLYSIVVFGRSATLKTISSLPDHCHVISQSSLRALLARLLASPPSLSESDLPLVKSLLNSHRVAATPLLRTNHTSDIASSLTNFAP